MKTTGIGALVPILFFMVVITGLALCFHFGYRVAPLALRLWAEKFDCEIIDKKRPILSDFAARLSFSISNTQQIYRLTLRDRDGCVYRCWATVGLFHGVSISPKNCPIVARWDGPSPDRIKSKPVADEAHPLRDRQIDG